MVSYAGLVIDLQDYSRSHEESHAEASATARNSGGLLKRMKDKRVPKVIMEFLPGSSWGIGKTLPVVMEHVDNGLDIIVNKDLRDAFAGTERYGPTPIFDGYYTSVHILSHLRWLAVTDLIVAGWHLDFCVRKSVISALNYCFKVHTSPDICGPARCPFNELSNRLYDGNAPNLFVYGNVEELVMATIK